MRTGELKEAISRYKYEDKRGWASIFGRVLVGYLDEHRPRLRLTELITASPTYVGEGSRRSWDHIAMILRAAAIESSGRWPFDLQSPPAIIKNAETPRMVGGDAATRSRVAEDKLRPALEVPNRDRVYGKRIVVLDDVFTGGTTLNTVARVLKDAGAAEVVGLVLARSPWGGGTG